MGRKTGQHAQPEGFIMRQAFTTSLVLLGSPQLYGTHQRAGQPDSYNPGALRISTARMSCSLNVTRSHRRVRVGMPGQVLECCVG